MPKGRCEPVWHVTVERDGDEADGRTRLEAVVRTLIAALLKDGEGGPGDGGRLRDGGRNAP